MNKEGIFSKQNWRCSAMDKAKSTEILLFVFFISSGKYNLLTFLKLALNQTHVWVRHSDNIYYSISRPG